jgi:hypothetical protein
VTDRLPRVARTWRRVYAVSAAVALYLDVFVGVVQAFLKASALKAMAPTQTEPPFVIAQILVLALFVVLGSPAAIRFRPEAAGGPRARVGAE